MYVHSIKQCMNDTFEKLCLIHVPLVVVIYAYAQCLSFRCTVEIVVVDYLRIHRALVLPTPGSTAALGYRLPVSVVDGYFYRNWPFWVEQF